MERVQEGAAIISAPQAAIMTKKLDIFYNPAMRLNRDLTLLFLTAREKKDLRIADPLAGSGVRSIRMRKELPEGMLASIGVNDCKEGFAQQFKENCTLSGCTTEHMDIKETDANRFLLESSSFDYIDIDPFGSPNPFLDAAIKKTRRNGILAVTATDTAPLCGTYPKACMRKYWARPRRDHLMHEYGLRILIRKCQLIGAQYEKALVPLFCYSKHHYFRVFLEVRAGKTKVDEILAHHDTIDCYGPLWTGSLWDEELVQRMRESCEDREQQKLLDLIIAESKINIVGFYDVHDLSASLKLKQPPKHENVLQALHKRGIPAAHTHFSPLGIKASCDEKTIKQAMKESNDDRARTRT